MTRLCTIAVAGRPDEDVWLTECVYQFPDGSRASAIVSLAWCFRCSAFVAAECLLSIAEIDATIVELTTRPFSQMTVFIYGEKDEYRERVVADYRRLRAGQLSRKSLPKCIACGSDQIQYIDHRPFSHPRDGAECIASEGWASGYTDRTYLLDVEGNRIGETSYDLFGD